MGRPKGKIGRRHKQQLGVVVDDSLHSGLEGIMQGNTTNIQEKYAEGSFLGTNK